MRNRAPSARGGFTLIELLVVFAVIMVIAGMLIPLFLDAMNKARQRKTMAEVHSLGKAMMSWVTDMSGAGAAGAGATMIQMSDFDGPIAFSDLEVLLVTQYIQDLPRTDGWRQPIEAYLDQQASGSTNLIAVRSSGHDGLFDGDSYVIGPFQSNLYERDIVWADGFFVRWPERIAP